MVLGRIRYPRPARSYCYTHGGNTLDIIGRIKELSVKHAVETGITPHNVYVGHFEMKELLFWAEKNCYISDAKTAKKVGDDRPEVNGMKVFEVNAENHLACGV